MDYLNSVSVTNKLLLCIVVPLVLYLLQVLSFIFIPLFGALLVALLFLPLLRFFYKKNVPRWLSFILVSSFIFFLGFIAFVFLRLSIKEIVTTDEDFWLQMHANINRALTPIIEVLAIDLMPDEDNLSAILSSQAMVDSFPKYITPLIGFANSILSKLLMVIFFLLLLLGGSINVQKLLEKTIFKTRIPSMRAFVTLEKSIFKFIFVKTVISIATGISVGLACVFFDIKFPVFWGLIAFSFNYIQMVGSIFITLALTVFAVAQLDVTPTLLAFSLTLTGIQILFGSVLEPIFMGKTFSINTITILIMLMLWGFLWGIPGLILAVPITVVVKTILEQFPRTETLAKLMS